MTAPAITAIEAEAEAFAFLNDHLPDRIMPGEPRLDAVAQVWRVPVVLAYPGLGVLGELGEVLVSVGHAQIVGHTPIAEIKQAALALAEQHRDAIKAPLS